MELQKIKAILKLELYRSRYYWTEDILFNYLIYPLSYVIEIYLTGEFVSLVNFYHAKVYYALIILSSFIFIEIASNYLNTVIYRLTYDLPNIEPLGLDNFVIAKLLDEYFKSFTKTIIIVGALKLLIEAPLILVLFSLPFVFASLFFVQALLNVVSGLTLLLREDIEPLRWTLNAFLWVIFASNFSLSILPLPERNLAMIAIPSLGIIEEFRKLFFLGYYEPKIVILSILVSLIYLIFSLIFLNYSYHKAKREGKIVLV